MYEKTYGPKYNAELTRKEIAALIRADLKAAVASGELPKGLKTSVRKSGSSNLSLPRTAARSTRRP